MALDNLVDGMTGLQMANAIKDNFNKVLDAESAENKAENAGKSIKTDYDATRYIELQLADGTPVKMKMDVFCQAIAPVVAGIVRKTYQIPSRGMINTGIKTKCMLISINDSASYVMGVHLIYSDGTFREIVPNTGFAYGVNVEGSVCVIAQGKDIVLKNNIDSSRQVCLFAFMA